MSGSNLRDRGVEALRNSRFARWPGLLLPVALLAAILFAANGLSDGADRETVEHAATPVEVVELVPSENFTTRSTYIGRVEARRRSELGFELGGELASVMVDEGQSFGRGQVLARLDTARLRARRQELAMQLARARAEAQAANSRYTRNTSLRASTPEAVAEQALDDARYAADAASAQVSAVNAQIAALDVDIRRARIVAPYSGIVEARRMDEGEIAAAGMPVLTVLETAAPEARIGIPAANDTNLSPGSRVLITVDGVPMSARVTSIGVARSSETRTVDLIATLGAPLGTIRDGDLASLEIERQIPGDGFWVPLSALTESRRGLWSVLVVEQRESEASPILVRREVELVGQDQNRAFVRGALQRSDLVVASGLQRLAAGAPVSISRRRRMNP